MNVPLSDANRLYVALSLCRMAQKEYYGSHHEDALRRRTLLNRARRMEKIADEELERFAKLYPAACSAPEGVQTTLFSEDETKD